MPALTDRDQYEAAIVAGLLPVFHEQLERTIKAPRLESISYEAFQAGVQQVLAAELFRAYTSASAMLVIGHSLTFTAGAFEDTARRWSDNFARKTAREVTATSRRLTDKAWRISQGDRRAQQQIEADFQRALQAIYSPARMNAIAITSVTAAVSNGEHAVVFFFPENRHRRMVALWVTVEEAPGVPAESVCEICAPFDQHARELWGSRFPVGPPAHVNCRCHLQYVEAAEWARRAA